MASQLGHRVLGRLGLELVGAGDERDQGHVDEEDRGSADVVAELADRLEEGKALDVSDGAADLGDDDIDVVAARLCGSAT